MADTGHILAPFLLFLIWPLALAFGHGYAIFRETKHSDQPVKKVRQFIYNEKLGTVFNKDSSSWIRTTVYYAIFISCLSAYIGVLGGFCVLIIDKDHPMKQDMDSMMQGNPGLAYKPVPDMKSNLIRFVQGDSDSYQSYISNIDMFLQQYENDAQEGNDFQDCKNIKLKDRNPKKVCSFKIETLGEDCQDNKDFGFDIGEPCILIKMNKIYGWMPQNYSGMKVPDEIKDIYHPEHLAITCEGESPADKENLGDIVYHPPQGLPFIYYPFLNQEGYRQPSMFVKFLRPRNGVLIQVSCKIWASNIYHHRNDRAGSLHFELLVD